MRATEKKIKNSVSRFEEPAQDHDWTAPRWMGIDSESEPEPKSESESSEKKESKKKRKSKSKDTSDRKSKVQKTG